jgi:hypothetical protein
MSNTVDDAIGEIQTQIAALTGIRSAPKYIEDKALPYPFVFAYPGRGRMIASPQGCMTGMHDIVLEFHVARKDLPRDAAKAYPYVDSIANKIMYALTHAQFTNIITAFGDDGGISYEFGALEWAGEQTLGFVFTIEQVKLQAAISS